MKTETFNFSFTREQVSDLIDAQDLKCRVIAGFIQKEGIQAVEDGSTKQLKALALSSILSAPLIAADKAKEKTAAGQTPGQPKAKRRAPARSKRK